MANQLKPTYKTFFFGGMCESDGVENVGCYLADFKHTTPHKALATLQVVEAWQVMWRDERYHYAGADNFEQGEHCGVTKNRGHPCC